MISKQVTMTRSERPHETCRTRWLRNGKLELLETSVRAEIGRHTWEHINQSREGYAGDLNRPIQFDVCGFAEGGAQQSRLAVCGHF